MDKQEKTEPKKKVASHSQFSTWSTCKYKYFLDYIKGLRTFEDNLIMSFGTAIHRTVQLYLKTLYNIGEIPAAKINMVTYFKWAFNVEIKKKKIPHTPEEYESFIFDGERILGEFRTTQNLMKYFPAKLYELVGIEVEIREPILNNIDVIAFLDLVLKNKVTGKIKIVDIKTSTNDWNVYQKKDKIKISQVLLYKALYSKKYNVPLSMIDVEFYILRRKFYENASFAQSHIQSFVPTNTADDVMETIKNFSEFVKVCFTPTGEYNVSGEYPKTPGKANKNCKYCMHKGVNCDGKPS